MKTESISRSIPLLNLISVCAFSLFLAACGGNGNSSSSSGSSSSGSSSTGSSSSGSSSGNSSSTGSSSSSSSGGSSTGSSSGSSTGATPPLADYGDAPDGGASGYPAPFAQTAAFPSLLASNGARIVDVSAASLGSTNTEETDANVINDDIDDGVIGFGTVLTSIPPPTTMTVNVTGTEDGNYYFNSLIDLNMDGKWGGGTGANGESEWVVRNQPIAVEAGVIKSVTSPPFAFTNGLLVPTHAWIRVALTKEQVPQDWDGSGEFSKGEIEDHVISMPIIDGKEVPMLSVDCGGPYKFNGAASIKVTCVVTNYRSVAGNFSHEVIHQPGGGTVDVRNCVPATPPNLPIGAAALPGDIPNPNPAASVTIMCDAFKGQTPDVWTFKATAIDPLFFSSLLGFNVAHSETTSIEIEILDDDPIPNVLFLTEFDVTNDGFSGKVGGPQGCFDGAQVNAEVRCASNECGNYSESTLLELNPDGTFKLDRFDDAIPPRNAGSYEVEVVDINSPDSPSCLLGARYGSELNTFVPFPSNMAQVPHQVTVTNLETGEVIITPGVSHKFPFTAQFGGPPQCFEGGMATFRTAPINSAVSFEHEQVLPIGPTGLVTGNTEVFFFGGYNLEIKDVLIPSATGCEYFPNLNTGPTSIPFTAAP